MRHPPFHRQAAAQPSGSARRILGSGNGKDDCQRRILRARNRFDPQNFRAAAVSRSSAPSGTSRGQTAPLYDVESRGLPHTLQDILKWNSSIRHFQFIRSHESYFVQLADILMGAINYNLRIEKGDVEGKVIAKRKLVDKIQEHADISLNRTTPLSKKKFNLFFISLK